MGYLIEKIERRKQALMAETQDAGETGGAAPENEESQKRA
jgi:hypothetical protein